MKTIQKQTVGFIIAIAFLFNTGVKACKTTVVVQQPICNGGTGSATANSSDGATPYNFTWSNGKTTPTVTGLTAGYYTVTVIDAVGCSTTNLVTIVSPPPITINVSTTSETCYKNNGSANALSMGGTGTHTFTWNTGATTTAITGLSTGVYRVTVKDANGCTNTSGVFVANITPTASITSTNVSCFGGSNGSATVNISGGTPPNTSYTWSNGKTTQTITGVPAGSYFVIVTDANGCVSSTSGIITEPAKLTVGVTTTLATCNQSNGAATANATGGTGSYSYVWSNGDTGKTASNLAAGIYTVTVKDANGCVTTTASAISCFTVTGINETSVNQPFNIYPNPATTKFTVETKINTPYSLQIINLLGHTVYSTALLTDIRTELDVSIFPKGIYGLQLRNEQNNVYDNRKLIIQ